MTQTRLKAILFKWGGGSLPPLLRNGYALVFSSAAGSGLGLLYWALAARLYSPEVVGLNSAMLSAMLFLSGLAQLGLNSVLMRFLPVAGGASGRLIGLSYLAAGGLTGFASLIFWLGLRWWAPALENLADPRLFGLFALSAVAWSIFTLQDSALTGLRRATWTALENTTFAGVKIVLLVGLAGLLPTYGIYASWVLPLVVFLLLVNRLIFTHLLPAHPGYKAAVRRAFTRRQAARFVAGNYLGSLFFTASVTLIPLVVANQAGAAAAAYFYLPWTISLALQYAALQMSASFTVESTLAPEQLAAYSYRIFVQTLRVLLPVVGFLLLAARPALLLFGPEYAAQSANLLRLLALSAVPGAALALYLGVARVQQKTMAIAAAQAAVFGLATGLGLVLSGPLGITGFGLAWLISQTLVGGTALAFSLRPLLAAGRLIPNPSPALKNSALGSGAGGDVLPPSPTRRGAGGEVPLVSIIINNFNYAQYLGEAIHSALDQTHRPREVIVVDDGSTDNSQTVIASFGKRIRPVFQENRGQAGALNAGFAASRGEVIIFLDADDRLAPECAAWAAAALQANPQAGRAHSYMETIDAQGRRLGGRKPAAHLALPRGDLRQAVLAFPEDLPWLPTSGNAYPAAVLRQIMPIPEADFRILADFYLSHLSALFGPLQAIEQVEAYYRVHGANHHEPPDRQVDVRRVRQAILHWQRAHIYLRQAAGRLGLPCPDELLSVTFIANRLISLRLEPEQHPIPGDSRWNLTRKGWQAARRRSDVPARRKLIFAGWFAAMLLAPRAGAARLAERFLFGGRSAFTPGLSPKAPRLHFSRPEREPDEARAAALIVNHNTFSDLAACLESLPAQAAGQVIVFDNASTDGSAERVRASYPQVQLIASPTNLGYGAAANCAATANRGAAVCRQPAASAARYILLLNSDTRLAPGGLDRLVEYMEAHPQVAIAGPRLLNPDGSPQPGCFHFPLPGRVLQRETSLGRLARPFPETAGPVPWVLGAALMIRREAFTAVGGFDEDFFLYYEEVDLCYRLRQAGWEIHYAPVTEVVHTGGASTRQQPGGMTGQLYASLDLFYRKHYSRLRRGQLRAVITYLMLRNMALDHTAGGLSGWAGVLRQAWKPVRE